MALWFRALAALAQDSQSEFQYPHGQLTTISNSSPRGSDGLLWLPCTKYSRGAQPYMQMNAKNK